MIKPRTPAAAFALVAAITTFATACGEQVCNLVGCTSGVTVNLPAFDGGDRFDVVVETAVGAGSFGCERVEAGGYDVVDIAGDFANDDSVLTPSCRRDGFILGGNGLPATLTTTVSTTANGAEVSRTGSFTDIDYGVHRPNGPDCEPECRNAAVELE